MIYFANPTGSKEVHDAMRAGVLGFIDTPHQSQVRLPVTWCADNGCFNDKTFNEDRWWQWLVANAHDAGTCMFATAPDIVGDAWRSHFRSAPWLPKIRALGYPVAYVAQNGLHNLPVPWLDFDVLFIGGTKECLPCGGLLWEGPGPGAGRRHSFEPVRCPRCGRVMTEWKEGAHARHLVWEAKERGKWVHMGRVNGESRVLYARDIGCDSVDGTYLTFAPLLNLPNVKGWVQRIHHDLPLFRLDRESIG